MAAPQLIFAVLLGLVAVAAIGAAFRAWRQGTASHREAGGWGILSLAAVGQAVNLLLGYWWMLSVLTTGGILIGLWSIATGERNLRAGPSPRVRP